MRTSSKLVLVLFALTVNLLLWQNFERVPGLQRVVELPLGLKADFLRLPAGEVLDPSMIELGNLLFFDRRLSKNGTMSCATCHEPAKGYSATVINKGVDGNTLNRATPSALNRAFGDRHDWIGRKTLEQQSTAPITNVLEMGLTTTQLINIVSGIPGYVDRFNRLVDAGLLEAPAISVKNIQFVMATFQRSLFSAGSRVDRYESGERTALTPTEIAGRNLFHGQGRCVLCHAPPLYTNESFHNILSGCPVGPGQCFWPTGDERGRMLITGLESDRGRFKTPSLRNVGLRGPYFHRGNDSTLDIVVNGYNNAGDLDSVIGQDPLLINLGLTDAQEAQIVAFLKALSGGIPFDEWLSQPGTSASSSHRENIYFSPDIFNTEVYRNQNSDLAGLSDGQLRSHWLTTGMKEGRRGNGPFLVKQYVTVNSKVNNTLKSQESAPDYYKRAIDHYLDYGRRQGMIPRGDLHPNFFNPIHYRGYNPGINQLVYSEAIDHYGRIGLPNSYLAHRDPRGHFHVSSKSFYYSNGKGYCTYPSRAAFNAAIGNSDLIGVPSLVRVPENLFDGGTCDTSTNPPALPATPTDKTVTFFCQISDSNAVCNETAWCPTGMDVKSFRAACNLEFGQATMTYVRTLPWNSLSVQRQSDNVSAGVCQVEFVQISSGTVSHNLKRNRYNALNIACKEHDDNGGDCDIRGEMVCGY